MAKHRRGYLYKRNGIYQLEYFINGKRFKQSLGVTKKADAEKLRLKIMKPLEIADDIDVVSSVKSRLDAKTTQMDQHHQDNNPPTTLQDAWNVFLTSKMRNDSGDVTLSRYNSQFKRLKSWLKRNHAEIKYINQISPAIAGKFMDFIQTQFRPRTYNAYLIFFLHMFEVLAEPARIEENPWSKKFIRRKKLKGKQTSRRELTSQELRDVINPTKGEFRLLFAIGIFTGFRLGDAATLKWSEVDLDRRIIRRIPMKTAHTSGKTVKIGIPITLYSLLNEIPLSKRVKYVLPDTAHEYNACSSSLTKRIQQHFEECGIETKMKQEGKRASVVVGFHSLRHTYVSIHAEAGTPQAIIRDLVGHGSVAMTEHYEHISDEAAILHAKSLPSIIDGQDKDIPSGSPDDKISRCIASLEAMNSKNWEKKRNQALKELGI